MKSIEEHLSRKIMQAPNKQYRVIVRTDRSFATITDQLCRPGIVIHSKFRFIRALVITTSGEILLTLANNPHILYIESDAEVRAL